MRINAVADVPKRVPSPPPTCLEQQGKTTPRAERASAGSQYVVNAAPAPNPPSAVPQLLASAEAFRERHAALEARLAPAAGRHIDLFPSQLEDSPQMNAFAAYKKVLTQQRKDPAGWLAKCESYEGNDRWGAVHALPLGREPDGGKAGRKRLLSRWWYEVEPQINKIGKDLRPDIVGVLEQWSPGARLGLFDRAKHKGDPEDMLLLARSVWHTDRERGRAMLNAITEILPRARHKRCSDDAIQNIILTAVDVARRDSEATADMIALLEAVVDKALVDGEADPADVDSEVICDEDDDREEIARKARHLKERRQHATLGGAVLALGAMPCRDALRGLQRLAPKLGVASQWTFAAAMACQPLTKVDIAAEKARYRDAYGEEACFLCDVLDAMHDIETFKALERERGMASLLLLQQVADLHPDALPAHARCALTEAYLEWQPTVPADVHEASDLIAMVGTFSQGLPACDTRDAVAAWLLSAVDEDSPWVVQACDRALETLGDPKALARLRKIRAGQKAVKAERDAEKRAIQDKGTRMRRELLSRG